MLHLLRFLSVLMSTLPFSLSLLVPSPCVFPSHGSDTDGGVGVFLVNKWWRLVQLIILKSAGRLDDVSVCITELLKQKRLSAADSLSLIASHLFFMSLQPHSSTVLKALPWGPLRTQHNHCVPSEKCVFVALKASNHMQFLWTCLTRLGSLKCHVSFLCVLRVCVCVRVDVCPLDQEVTSIHATNRSICLHGTVNSCLPYIPDNVS